jgi:diguanylate cyclase (GGDEF)-like protein/PAS domain S-box-containing protein
MAGNESPDTFQSTDAAMARRYRLLVEQAHSISFVDRVRDGSTGQDEDLEYISPQTVDVLGYTPEELLADPQGRIGLIHQKDRDRVLRDLDDARAARTRFAQQYRMVRKDGRVIWIDEDSMLAPDEGGEPQWQGTLQDVTKQKQGEQALRAGERRFRAIFDDAAVGIARIALDGWILEANDALAGSIGCDRIELVGSYLGTLDDTEGPDRVPEEFTRLSEGGIDRFEADRAYERRDGQAIWCHVVVSLIRDEDGVPEFAIGMFEDITARRAAEDELERRAMHDGLTGLPNRGLLLDRLHIALARTVRGTGLAVMFLDLDGFKGVNDRFGHDAGDRVLNEAAQRFTTSIRAADTLARLGGDEFVILCEDMDALPVALAKAERMVHLLDDPIELTDGTAVEIGVSIGVTYADDQSRDAEQLIRDADTAMYRAKEAGRGRVAASGPPTPDGGRGGS